MIYQCLQKPNLLAAIIGRCIIVDGEMLYQTCNILTVMRSHMIMHDLLLCATKISHYINIQKYTLPIYIALWNDDNCVFDILYDNCKLNNNKTSHAWLYCTLYNMVVSLLILYALPMYRNPSQSNRGVPVLASVTAACS